MQIHIVIRILNHANKRNWLRECCFWRRWLVSAAGRIHLIFICFRIREFAIILQNFSIDQFKMLIYLPRYDLEIFNLKKTRPIIHKPHVDNFFGHF